MMSSVPSVQPFESHMHLEANICHPERIHTQSPVSLVCTWDCTMSLCRVTICFSGVYLVNMHSCTQAWGCLDTTCSSGVKLRISLCRPYLTLAKTWHHKRALLPSLQHGHAGPTSGPGTSQCLYTESMSQMCCGAALVMGHAPV